MKHYVKKPIQLKTQAASSIPAPLAVVNKAAVQLKDNRPPSTIQKKQMEEQPVQRVSKTSGVVQRATSLRSISTGDYKYDNNKYKETAGKHAEDYLDPADPVHGSGPSSSALEYSMADLKKLGYKSMIKGHLLNGQLGGPGVAGNLFPITSSANSKHKMFAENIVKSHVNKGGKHGIYYSVEVTEAGYSTKSPNAKFTCEAYYWDTTKGTSLAAVDRNYPYLKPLDIESTPEKGSTGYGDVEGLLTGVDAFGKKFTFSSNDPTSMTFATKKLPKGWGEVGKGKGNKSHDWSHVTGMDIE